MAVLCRTLGVSPAGSTSGGTPRRTRAGDASKTPSWWNGSERSTGCRVAPMGHRGCTTSSCSGEGRRVGRKRIERLMRINGIVGIHKRRRGCTRRDPDATPSDDLVNRQFTLTVPTGCGSPTSPSTPPLKARCIWRSCSTPGRRRVIGWSIADHIRAELVVDALQMAIWRRRPPAGQTVHHSDHGCQYTSWAFGRRLRAAGVLGSMGSIGDAYDNAMAESFFSTLQRELLDEQRWTTRRQLALAVFEWIEAWYNPHRRHTSIGSLSPIDYETAHRADGSRTAA